MFKLKFTPESKRQLKKISKIYERNAIKEALLDIQLDPSLGKPLEDELKGRFSYRVGLYRIIYIVNWKNQTVTLLSAGHRATVYN